MDSRYPVQWTRSDGTCIPIELLNFPELVAAHQVLEAENMDDPASLVLLDAIESELILRWTQKTRGTQESESYVPKDFMNRAA